MLLICVFQVLYCFRWAHCFSPITLQRQPHPQQLCDDTGKPKNWTIVLRSVYELHSAVYHCRHGDFLGHTRSGSIEPARHDFESVAMFDHSIRSVVMQVNWWWMTVIRVEMGVVLCLLQQSIGMYVLTSCIIWECHSLKWFHFDLSTLYGTSEKKNNWQGLLRSDESLRIQDLSRWHRVLCGGDGAGEAGFLKHGTDESEDWLFVVRQQWWWGFRRSSRSIPSFWLATVIVIRTWSMSVNVPLRARGPIRPWPASSTSSISWYVTRRSETSAATEDSTSSRAPICATLATNWTKAVPCPVNTTSRNHRQKKLPMLKRYVQRWPCGDDHVESHKESPAHWNKIQ